MSLVDPCRRTLGSTGIGVGPLAYGCWRFAGTSVADARAKVEAALAAGMDLVDTADIYGFTGHGDDGFGDAESLLGAVLAEAPGLRDRIVLATKGGICPPVPYDSTPRRLRAAAEASLRRLGVDHVDLWQVHRPDLLAHPAMVAEALGGLVADGLTRSVGTSNLTPSQHSALHHHCVAAGVELVTIQPELSLLHQDPIDDGTLDQAMAHDLVPLAWSPVGGGRLVADDATSGRTGTEAAVVAVLDRLAEREGVDRAAIALAWVLAHPSRPVAIVGTQRPDRIAAAADALRVQLDRSDWYELAAAAGRPLP